MRYGEKLLKQKWKSLQCLPLCRASARYRGSGPTDRGGFSPTAAKRLPSQKKQLKPESRKSPQCLPLCRASARYRGSGSIEPKGLTHSRKAAFLQGWKSCNVDSFKPLRRSAPPPLSALSRGRGGHYYASVHTLTENTRISANTQRRTLLRFHFQQRTTAYLPTSQFSQPLTLNSKPQAATGNVSPVSPQRRRDRGSGPTDRGGFSPTAAKRLLDNSAKQ